MFGGHSRVAGAMALALLAGAWPSPVPAAWEKVTVKLQDPDGATRTVAGSTLSYGYYVREFTPKGVRDRLHIEKVLPFADRDVRLPDLVRIDFDLEKDGTTGLLVPRVMHIALQKKHRPRVEFERDVSELRGYGNPKPVLLIVETPEGKLELDLTPPYDEDAREHYRPILEIRFD